MAKLGNSFKVSLYNISKKRIIYFTKFKTNKNSSFALYPEVRIYQQPLTITSEADIKTTLFSDNFLVFNILKDDGYYNVRYQYKPLMIWIWISTIFISLGGLLSVIRKNEQKY